MEKIPTGVAWLGFACSRFFFFFEIFEWCAEFLVLLGQKFSIYTKTVKSITEVLAHVFVL